MAVFVLANRMWLGGAWLARLSQKALSGSLGSGPQGGMIVEFILLRIAMGRVTISLPQSVEDLARGSAREGESFSATVARLIEQGASAERGAQRPRYVASGDGPEDLGVAAERYLTDLVTTS